MAEHTRGRVLVIDDEPAVRAFLADALTYFGFGVDVAADGLPGLQQFRSDDHDAVITDICMPGMTGLEVLERLRSMDATVPVIFLTGSAAPGVLQRARASGGTLVHKPITLDKLQAVLSSVGPGASRG
jgi:CheY-like chemotaxis protein